MVAVLFAALNARSASEEATRAVDDAAAAQEMAAGVDRMATLGRTALSSMTGAKAASLPPFVAAP